MSSRAVIVGAGINGLVATNYLARAGLEVLLLERRERVGGACTSATAELDGERVDYAAGATVLGLMQDFVFRDTGLAERLRIWAPRHRKLVYFGNETEPAELETPNTFRRDETRVVSYLRQGYRHAQPPNLAEARDELGTELVERWIQGSARKLLDHYLSAERTKTYLAMTVIESGPVSLEAPYSAFVIPLMDSGTIFQGAYGFVEGGIWRITEELARSNEELGVTIETSARVTRVGKDTVEYQKTGTARRASFDVIVFATDPVSASKILGEPGIARGLELSGTSGKLTMIFREPVRWKDDTGAPDADAAFRFIFFNETMAELERASQQTSEEFVPGYVQIYCDGAGQRHLGRDERFDRIVCFFKNLRLGKFGSKLPEVERFITETVLERIENPEALVWKRMLTPRDLKERFLFPEGNIEHTMLSAGQTFAERRFSTSSERFYQFGARENVYYCGSGAYPCGSVTGTGGYMCAQELVRHL
jgi:phytoene dehydrogenase-like protein